MIMNQPNINSFDKAIITISSHQSSERPSISAKDATKSIIELFAMYFNQTLTFESLIASPIIQTPFLRKSSNESSKFFHGIKSILDEKFYDLISFRENSLFGLNNMNQDVTEYLYETFNLIDISAFLLDFNSKLSLLKDDPFIEDVFEYSKDIISNFVKNLNSNMSFHDFLQYGFNMTSNEIDLVISNISFYKDNVLLLLQTLGYKSMNFAPLIEQIISDPNSVTIKTITLSLGFNLETIWNLFDVASKAFSSSGIKISEIGPLFSPDMSEMVQSLIATLYDIITFQTYDTSAFGHIFNKGKNIYQKTIKYSFSLAETIYNKLSQYVDRFLFGSNGDDIVTRLYDHNLNIPDSIPMGGFIKEIVSIRSVFKRINTSAITKSALSIDNTGSNQLLRLLNSTITIGDFIYFWQFYR